MDEKTDISRLDGSAALAPKGFFACHHHTVKFRTAVFLDTKVIPQF